MSIKKNKIKSRRILFTSLLAISTTIFSMSLILGSCVTANDKNQFIRKDIVIEHEPDLSQEVSTDDTDGLTLSIDAKSTHGKELNYQWYQNKNDNKGWTQIAGATSNTYNVPSSEIQSVKESSTWQYKVEIKYDDESYGRYTSKTYSVKVNPATSTPDSPIGPLPEPEKPSIPETKPENPTPPTTEPEEPKPPIVEPEKPITPPTTEPEVPKPPVVEPEKPITPPTNSSDSDKPTIVPPPTHTPSQGIGGRLSNDSSGINTVKYDQEKWIGDNSISIAVMANPNIDNIRKSVLKYADDHPSGSNFKKQSLNRVLNNFYVDSVDEYNQFGTGWILDYSPATSGNLTDYYIATNMHVLSSYFTIKYTSSVFISSYVTKKVEATLRIPFTKQTVSSLNVYISQPRYDETDYKNNTNSYAYEWEKQWFKTDITIDNYESKLFPLGAYSGSNTSNDLMVGDAYDMEIQLVEKDNSNNSLDWSDAYYFGKSPDGQFLTQEATNGTVLRDKTVEDFSVLKLTMDSDKEFDKKISSAENKYKPMFQKMKEMFNVNASAATVNERSSYLTRLKKLIELTTNTSDYNKNKNEIDKLFMFYDKSSIVGDRNTQLSIGGYPVKYEGSGNNKKYYATYNMNTMTTLGNNIITYPYSPSDSRNKLGINQYTYKSGLYKVKFKSDNDFLMKNGMLQQGSSGGMVINKDYKIACINWGSYNYMQSEGEFKFLVESGIVTSIYSKTNKNSLVWEWISYVSSRDSNSQLKKLFDNLQKTNYFNS